MNNISEIPTEFSIELFCNTTLEQHILNAENIVSFIEKVLFKHPDIEGYKKGRISQGDFTNRVLNNGLTTEKHKALCLLAPDQFTIAAIRNLRIRYSRDLLTQRKLEVNNLGVLQPF